MRVLLILCTLLFSFSATAGLFDARTPTVLGAGLNNSADFLPVREAFRLSLSQTEGQSIKLRFVIAEGYYLYRQRLQVSSQNPELRVQVLNLPAGESKVDEYFGEVQIFRGAVEFDVALEGAGAQAEVPLKVSYQGCADKGLCYPPEVERFQVSLKGNSAQPLAQSEQNPELNASSDPLWYALLLFFLAGIGLTFTPCVLPMLPILSGVVLRGQPSTGRSLALSLAYVLPMALCFALLGTLTGLFGAELNIQARLQSPWILIPFSLLFVVLALAMFGLFELRLPAALTERLDRVAGGMGGTLGSAALLGVLSSLLVSPCVSAPLAGALLYISSSGDALGGGLRLLVLGLGMGAPLILLSVGGGQFLPKSGIWMLQVRNLFGVLLLGVSVWMLERLLPAGISLMLWGVLAAGTAVFLGIPAWPIVTAGQRLQLLAGIFLLTYGMSCWVGAWMGNSDPLRPLSGGRAVAAASSPWRHLKDPKVLEAVLQDAKVKGQPVLLDWYADWCISCKVMDREVFSDQRILASLQDFLLLRLDVTENTSAQRDLMNRLGVFGPPAILFFDQQGKEMATLRVVGEMDAPAFAQHLSKLKHLGLSSVNTQPSGAIEQ